MKHNTFLKKTIYIMVSSILAISQPIYANSMQTIVGNGYVFKVQSNMQKQYPELIDLIIMSESINNEKKQELLEILPEADRQHIDELFLIFVEERREIERLNKEFEDNVKALNKKHETENTSSNQSSNNLNKK